MCWLCFEPLDMTVKEGPMRVSVDHIVPVSKGGPNAPRNKLLAHQQCNCERGNPQLKVKRSTVIAQALSKCYLAAYRATQRR